VVGVRLPRARSRRAAPWRCIGVTDVSLGGGCASGGDWGCRCAFDGNREADAHSMSLEEAEARPMSLGGGGCVSGVDEEADAHPTSLGEGDACLASLREAAARPALTGR
jgi:hypothetical protein